MELTRDEMVTMHAVLYVLLNEVPYREANKYLGDITLDRACDVLAKLEAHIADRDAEWADADDADAWIEAEMDRNYGDGWR